MSSKKVFYIMLTLVVLAGSAGIASIVLGNSLLQKTSGKLYDLKLEAASLEGQQTALIRAKQDVEKYQEFEQIAKSIVPQDKDQARTVRELTLLAEEAGINIASITFPNSELGQPKPIAAAPTAEGGTESTPAAPAAPSITQVKPAEGIPGLYQMEITLTITDPVPYSQLIDFLQKLEQNRRTAQVTSLNIKPDTKNRNLVQFDLTVNVFIKP